ncbi:MAG TPA: C39 family peptidase [Candidatus Saccharimonadales bacterium]|nr:C39 family peptidase [Candidatus Saccharimonadales bacterium]
MTNIAPRVIYEEMPYHSQFASPELVGPIVFGEMQAKDDPRWSESGASTPEEYARWAWNLCGMVCLKSVLEYTDKPGKEQTLMALARTCIDEGGYVVGEDEIKGLYYGPFVKFAEKEFGLEGRVASPLSIADIVQEINDGNFVIASVHPTIRDFSPPPRQGGHLVLLTGYDIADENGPKLYYHDPAGLYEKSQAFASAPVSTFEKYFAGRGVVLTRPPEAAEV